ncbi:MAG TPA: hypothetical protein ENI09_01205 [candidate division WWE3 bacterium]|uniref:Uncharacterized protein n=1 Tax=candidate division WWE3 bacterium TaxID=2053526 RepID=A0A7C1S9X0_UNCKA|nr:hypothetical protein [candidate division WWE3 bacterium]
MSQCTFGYSKKPCYADGVWYFRELEDFYCARHAQALRALVSQPYLADLVVGGRNSACIGDVVFRDLSNEDIATAEQLIWETYPDAVAVKYTSVTRSAIAWFPADHEFFSICEGEFEIVERE